MAKSPTGMPRDLPTSPGVYLMKDRHDEVLYVGKAVNLRARVRTYFTPDGDGRPRIPHLMARVHHVEVVVTGTEKEALIVENTLIKKFQPRFNVLLKDDKTWLSVRIDERETWPRVKLVRKWRDDGARYFGPYFNGVRAREVERLIRAAFQLRTCTDAVFRQHRKRPCIQYNMGNCVAPCVDYVDEPTYAELVRQVTQLLDGHNRALVRELTAKMGQASEALRFEEAASLRDRIRTAEKVAERQRVQRAAGEDQDAFGLHREGDVVTVALLPVRGGKVEDPQAFTFHGVLEEDEDVLQQVVLQLYGKGVSPAPEVLLPLPVTDGETLAEILAEAAGRRVQVRTPQRGSKVQLVAMANQNAQARHVAAATKRELLERGTLELKNRLHLAELPRRIECFDISHLGGTDTVASMVVLEDGEPLKKAYRTFSVRDLDKPDDYASMRQVMERRLRRVDKGWRLPDLLVVDGGKGQLNAARAAAADVGLDVPLAALAKPDAGELERNAEATDKVFLPDRKNPVRLSPHSPGLHLLQRVRDEAHRFAVSHQRRRRKKRTLTSELDGIPGVGPARRRALLRHFGSMRSLKGAEVDDIAAVEGIGPSLAETIHDRLAEGS